MAALASPITGILVDRIGKRPLVSMLFFFVLFEPFVYSVLIKYLHDPWLLSLHHYPTK